MIKMHMARWFKSYDVDNWCPYHHKSLDEHTFWNVWGDYTVIGVALFFPFIFAGLLIWEWIKSKRN